MRISPPVITCLSLGIAGLLFVPAAAAADEATGDNAVRYEDFGARGDGVADDFEALIKAHEHANQHMLPVKATGGATYRIGGATRTIPIETDTDFGAARFIIDDTKLENISSHVFQVRSVHPPLKINEVKTLGRNLQRIDAKLPGRCVVIASNHKVKRFIRRGSNANTGSPQTDVFLVGADGAIDPKTPIVWDFDEITSLQALPVDGKTLTIKGGRFTTIARNPETEGGYVQRNLAVNRSNVVIEGLEHLIEGEVKGKVSPYSGFLSISNCAHVEVRDTVLTARMTSYMGSYDISLTRALNVTFLNCRQSNSINEPGYWGIMGSNFCKNLILDGCSFNRFDAHQGVTNATIRNSTIGCRAVQLTGFGTFLIENTTVQAPAFINLRPDYGSTWDGEVIIRNCRFQPTGHLKQGVSVIGGSNDGQHDFGYACQMPWRVTIDKLHIDDSKASEEAPAPAVLGNISPKWTDDSYRQPFPYGVTREVVLKDVTMASGKTIRIGENPFMFRHVKLLE